MVSAGRAAVLVAWILTVGCCLGDFPPYPGDFTLLIQLLTGVFDNKAQYDNEVARRVPPQLRHNRTAWTLTPQNVSFLADKVNLYLQESLGDGRGQIGRQRLCSFGMNRYTLAMEERWYELKNASHYVNATANDPRFARLAPDDVTFSPGCDVFWYKDPGSSFLSANYGSWMTKTCFADVGGDKTLKMTANNLTFEYLTLWERQFANNGSQISGLPTPFNLTRQG